MDAYSDYNQILMHEEDREKTTFMTKHTNYQDDVMTFDLKNVGATCQRMMNKLFAEEINVVIELYTYCKIHRRDIT